eukprot:3451452-Pleurochrysis_carterae.AAC.2
MPFLNVSGHVITQAQSLVCRYFNDIACDDVTVSLLAALLLPSLAACQRTAPLTCSTCARSRPSWPEY